ncbi:MAG TPA: hypothetical protein VGP04_11765 [Pseudonocardiaceae bacterium]|nr:hypothetical protein [Pseudonocardiaceae bacterium]
MALSARRYRRVRITARIAALAVVALLAGLAGADLPALAQGTAPAPTSDKITTWFAGLVPDEDDTNVRFDAGGLRVNSNPAGPASIKSGRPEGMLLTAVQPLATFSSQVAAEIVAEQPAGSVVAVDVRGTRGDGSWTEWMATGPQAPAMLGAAVTAVQSRLLLRGGQDGASPVVRSVRLTARPGVQLLAARPRNPPGYRVFATREGLVGATTANGHVIHERDHFVALPSRRGLAPRESGDYTVKICAANGRCEWAPVWDVGPWNTTDDYWNPSDSRQTWPDLPQGRPQAQAAYEDKYHDGRDQFGRQVHNPAGIDLADGTFWDGLGLRDNGWVTVTYLWVDGGSPAIVRLPLLPVRSGPGEKYPVVGLAAQRARVMVECAVTGQLVAGSQGSTDRWLRIGPKQFIPAAHVGLPRTTAAVPDAAKVQQVSAQRCASP